MAEQKIDKSRTIVGQVLVWDRDYGAQRQGAFEVRYFKLTKSWGWRENEGTYYVECRGFGIRKDGSVGEVSRTARVDLVDMPPCDLEDLLARENQTLIEANKTHAKNIAPVLVALGVEPTRGTQ